MAPPWLAWLPLRVVLVTVSAPVLKMPPLWEASLVAELVIVNAPPFPLAMVKPEIATVNGEGITNTCRAWLPLTVMTEAPGPSMVRILLTVKGGRSQGDGAAEPVLEVHRFPCWGIDNGLA